MTMPTSIWQRCVCVLCRSCLCAKNDLCRPRDAMGWQTLDYIIVFGGLNKLRMKMAKELGYKYFFSVQEIAFGIIAIDITAKEKSVKSPFLLAFSTANMFVLICLCLTYGWDNRQDTDKLTEGVNFGVMCFIVVYKMLIFASYQRQIQKTIHNIFSLLRTDDEEERAIISSFNKTASYFSAGYFLMGHSTMAFFFIWPLVIMAVIYFKTGEVVPILPIQANYYIDYSELWVYFLLVLWIFFALAICGNCTSAFETLYFWFAQNIKAQFQVLNIKIKRAGCLENDSDMNAAIIECIRFHQQIIELAEDFNIIFRPIIFLQFAIISLSLCFSGFLVTIGTLSNMSVVTYLGFMNLQIGWYCSGGQILQNESLNISDNIYVSFPWERVSKKNKTLLLLTMLRAQKACTLTGIFFVVDMELFVWVFSTTISYITVLRTLDANSKK